MIFNFNFFKILRFRKWIRVFFFSSDERYLFFFFFFSLFRVQRYRYEFSTGAGMENKGSAFRFCCVVHATNNDNRCLTFPGRSNAYEKKEVIEGLLTMHLFSLHTFFNNFPVKIPFPWKKKRNTRTRGIIYRPTVISIFAMHFSNVQVKTG